MISMFQVVHLNWWPLVRDCTVYAVSVAGLAIVMLDELIYWYNLEFDLPMFSQNVIIDEQKFVYVT